MNPSRSVSDGQEWINGIASNGKPAYWSSEKLPTGADCRRTVAEHPVHQTVAGAQYLTCSVTVDTAHLR
ncbi:hypothetical protein [Streptomyces sp. NPDC050759]|uniref:hypothetical protein n=1 Tax=Streptomyces sp. NPDC050759 TaxID=3365635 RepID=UPI0037BA9131